MRMSHTNIKNVIKVLGGDQMLFLLLLIHTLNILFYEFDSNASINFLTFKCHTQKNGTDLRRSPPVILVANFRRNFCINGATLSAEQV